MAQDLKFIELSAEFTRPANTTAYQANKVVSDGSTVFLRPLKPDGQAFFALRAGGSYQIKSAQLTVDSSGTTNATFDLYMYSSGVTAQADQTAFNPTYANKAVRIGKTTLVLATGDTNTNMAEAVNTDVNHLFKATDYTEANGIGFMLVAGAAYTPTSGEKFYIKLTVINVA